MALSAPPTNGAPVVTTLSLISRLGWKRAGTRFNTRGIDDDGNTANFVEVGHLPIRGPPDLIMYPDRNDIFNGSALLQLRPSARQRPLSVFPSSTLHVEALTPFSVFWEQQGLQTFGQRIQITRPTASQPAFDRHFAQIIDEYGSVHAINLLGTKDAEASLSHAYAKHLQAAKSIWGSDIGITHFDFHNAVRLGGHESVLRDLKYASFLLELDYR
jgi:hypothetical protein